MTNYLTHYNTGTCEENIVYLEALREEKKITPEQYELKILEYVTIFNTNKKEY